MVVLVLMFNCHCSEKLTNGPQRSQNRTAEKATTIAALLPLALVTCEAAFSKKESKPFSPCLFGQLKKRGFFYQRDSHGGLYAASYRVGCR